MLDFLNVFLIFLAIMAVPGIIVLSLKGNEDMMFLNKGNGIFGLKPLSEKDNENLCARGSGSSDRSPNQNFIVKRY